jgi:hypothetical protein
MTVPDIVSDPVWRNHMLRRPGSCLMLAILACAGCDVLFSTAQSVDLTVSNRATGAAAASARVTLAPVDGYTGQQAPDEWMDSYLKTMNVGSYGTIRPTNTGVTDENGSVSIAVDTSVFVCGWFNFEKPHDDRLSGTEYFVRIRTPASVETVRVPMKPGSRVEGQTFIVDVERIGQAYDLRAGDE